MFHKLLIANRGEIACRVARAARALGVRTVAVYSDADERALHVEQCDESVRVGPAPARESYLDAKKVLAAAKQTGAEAIHPGYGFLSEQADFAQACAAAGVVFVGVVGLWKLAPIYRGTLRPARGETPRLASSGSPSCRGLRRCRRRASV